VYYRVRVSRAGNFRLAYRVATFPATKDARIQLSVPAGGGGWALNWLSLQRA
jgi:hypothetical protein